MRIISPGLVLAVTLLYSNLFPIPVSPRSYASITTAEAAFTSELWGQDGEKWHAASRLPDFSFAGYHSGDRSLPTVPVKTNVKDFGATGDGQADDTAAFKAAIAATNNGALYIPAGRYKLTNILEIKKSNVVLRGAGEGKTMLFLARPLEALFEQIPFGTSLIAFRGSEPGVKLATVTSPAERGDRTLVLSSTTGIQAGQMIRLMLTNPANNSLGCYLYADQGCLNAERQSWGRNNVDWKVQVQAVQGNTVTLVRPLRLDVRLEWQPSIWQYRPTVKEVGIEQLTIEFPNEQYRGHHKEAGYNALGFTNVFNGWIRHVTIVDADSNIEFFGGAHNTITNITLTTKWRTPAAAPDGSGATGHVGFMMTSRSQDNLITESEIQTKFIHNMAVANYANGNVYAGILSQYGRFDHHGAAPYENLYTEIVLTRSAGDLFVSGGIRKNEPNGTRMTLWNVVTLGSNFPSTYNTTKFIQLTMVGVDQWATTKTTTKEWIERWPGSLTSPVNLYEAQLQRRHGQATGPFKLWLEAEAGTAMTQPLVIGTDAAASGGKYVWVPNGQGNLLDAASSGGEAVYSFSVPAVGTYALWGRIMANNGDDDSFFVQLDNATYIPWFTPLSGQETWGWRRVKPSDGTNPDGQYTLSAGKHTLRLKQREDGTKLDKLLITNDLTSRPN